MGERNKLHFPYEIRDRRIGVRGWVVGTKQYVDLSLIYQGQGASLEGFERAGRSTWPCWGCTMTWLRRQGVAVIVVCLPSSVACY